MMMPMSMPSSSPPSTNTNTGSRRISYRHYGIVIATLSFVLVFHQLSHSSSESLTSFQLPAYLDYQTTYHEAKFVEIGDSSENELPPGCDYASTKLDYSKTYDTCIVGAGLSGTVFAERTANLLKKNVLVIDSRPHIGGNCYDFVDQKTGILRNQYGSHLFHTKIQRVWDYVNSNPQAPRWNPWYHQKFGRINGNLYEGMLNGTFYVPIPVNILTVNRLFGLHIQTEEEMNEWLKTVQIPCDAVKGCQNAEEMAKSRVGEALYKAIFETYTIKQWDRSPKDMNASVTARIPVRSDFDPRYFADKWQALPSNGYTAWFEAMLKHPLIDVVLETDFFDHQQHLEGPACKTIVYTGPVDRYFADQGMEKLQYRSITFTEERHYQTPGYILPTPVLNYPGPETPYTRAIEYKHYLHQESPHSIVVKETTSDEGEPYYPIPNPRNLALYEKYKQMADDLEQQGKFIFVGRLANYKYFDMDKALLNALQLFDLHANKTTGGGSTGSSSKVVG
ncbi:galactopyranose mutase [Seminavis robusta]|uniref:Galactopyranose mutase n=1 Tax=Seminavis robusta TaxID=568900 RepID=A0A9N8E4N3_9STRA|nr:galactopyranose mutase [Seminavis robusta]|eukprot:Sro539_g162720.1 galactopyranose mutase (506) ;mRNA; r:785-2302